MVLNFCNSGY